MNDHESINDIKDRYYYIKYDQNIAIEARYSIVCGMIEKLFKEGEKNDKR